MQLSRSRALGAAAAGGLLLALAFPRYAIRPLAFPAVALLLWATYRQPWRTAGLAGLAFGATFFVPLLSWLQVGAGTNAWLILAALETAILAVGAVGLAYASRLPLWPLWTACVLVADEAVRGRVPFGGFTWGRLAYSQDAGPLLRWAAVGGAPLMTFLVALTAGLLVVAVRQATGAWQLFTDGTWTLAAIAATLAIAPVAVAPLLPGPPPATRTATVAVVQGNVPRLGFPSFDPRQQDLVVANHVAATRQLAADIAAGRVPKPDFVVWPENSTDRDPRHDPALGAEIDSAVREVGVPVLVGAVLDAPDDPAKAENAGVVWSPDTGFGARYVKRHLVPFGEYVPFRRYLTGTFSRLALVAHDFVPSPHGTTTLDIAGVRIGDVICFEVAYDGLVRDAVRAGAELLVVQTNNATFGHSALTTQQLAMSRIRAVEHGRAVLVAATSGISAVVGPDGHVVARSRIDTRAVLVRTVPLSTSDTPATRIGVWPEWLMTAAGLSAVAVGARR